MARQARDLDPGEPGGQLGINLAGADFKVTGGQTEPTIDAVLRQLTGEYLRYARFALLSSMEDSSARAEGHQWAAAWTANEQKVSLTVVKRTIWAAHLEFIDRVLAGDHSGDLLSPTGSPELIDRISRLTRQCLTEITRIYDGKGEPAEGARLVQTDRTDLLLSIVAGGEVDEALAGERLGLRFAEHHAAAVLTCPLGAGASSIDLVRFSLAFSRAVGGRRPLVALNGSSEVWMWTRWADQPEPGKVARLSSTLPVPSGFRMVLGPVASGVRGFRRSMLGAQAAHRALGVVATKHWLNRYEDVPAVRLLTSVQAEGRWWAEEVLGALARDHGYHAELRATLRLYLAMGRSRARVAKEMHVHRNTIAYRVEKALTLLGRPVEEDDFEVRLALEIARISDGEGDCSDERGRPSRGECTERQ